MESHIGFILDLDGTLYRLRSSDGTFGNSDFYTDLRRGMYQFLTYKLGFSGEQAKQEYVRIKEQYDGAVSSGVEQEFGIGRYEWFHNTWNLDPTQYIEAPRDDLAELLAPIAERSMVLTAAPRVWALPALHYLGLQGLFADRVLTGEPDFRKPDPEVFKMIATLLQRECHAMVSIGDQEESDILPAQAVGMHTIKIGSAPSAAEFCASDIYEALAIARTLRV